MDPQRFHIEKEKIASGVFRHAFKARTTNPRQGWVIKRFQVKEWEKLEPIYNMDLQIRTRKRVQMHMTAKVIAQKLAAIARKSKVFTSHFSYDTSYFATLDNEPITVERFVDGEFPIQLNNDGNPCQKLYIPANRGFGAFFL